jgi:hypothetical protein
MIQPPKYPRTPYLWRDDGRTENIVPPGEREAWFRTPVVVEEKLDGANVCLWLDDGQVRVASRGGVEAMDRAGQLGRLRAWGAQRHQALMELLSCGWVGYGEWLWLQHSVRYDSLPDWLVLLDLWSGSTEMVGIDLRDARAAAADLAVPPRLFEGVLGTPESLLGLLGRSAFGDETMEGVVLRRLDGSRCKIVRPGFTRRPDDSWDVRRTNRCVS